MCLAFFAALNLPKYASRYPKLIHAVLAGPETKLRNSKVYLMQPLISHAKWATHVILGKQDSFPQSFMTN